MIVFEIQTRCRKKPDLAEILKSLQTASCFFLGGFLKPKNQVTKCLAGTQSAPQVPTKTEAFFFLFGGTAAEKKTRQGERGTSRAASSEEIPALDTGGTLEEHGGRDSACNSS